MNLVVPKFGAVLMVAMSLMLARCTGTASSRPTPTRTTAAILATVQPQVPVTPTGTAYEAFAALARHGLRVPFAASYVLTYGDGTKPLRFKVWSEPEIPNRTQGDFVYQTQLHRGIFRFVRTPRYRLRVRASDGQGRVEVRRSLHARLHRPNHAGRVLPTPDVGRGTDQRRLLRAAQARSSRCPWATTVVPEPRRRRRLVPSSQRPVRLQPRPTGLQQSNGGGVLIAVLLTASIRPARKAAVAEGRWTTDHLRRLALVSVAGARTVGHHAKAHCRSDRDVDRGACASRLYNLVSE